MKKSAISVSKSFLEGLDGENIADALYGAQERKEKFFRIYISMNCDAYDGSGFNEKRTAYKQELEKGFGSLGWTCVKATRPWSNDRYYAPGNKEFLFAHPNSFCGVASERSGEEIIRMLKGLSHVSDVGYGLDGRVFPFASTVDSFYQDKNVRQAMTAYILADTLVEGKYDSTKMVLAWTERSSSNTYRVRMHGSLNGSEFYEMSNSLHENLVRPLIESGVVKELRNRTLRVINRAKAASIILDGQAVCEAML